MSCRPLAIVIAVALAGSGCARGDDTVGRGGDGGPRPGIDGGAIDGGSIDGGGTMSIDASGIDGGPPASLDGGPPPLPDGGPVPFDGGCPAGLTRCGAVCVDLRSDLAHCGMCSRRCDVAGGSESCTGGTCFVGTCDPGRGDCNSMAADGCEATCSAGAACSTSCGTSGTRSCASVCAPACTPPAEACNALDDDCNGACESGLPGCRRGVHRSVHPSTGDHFYSIDTAEAGCCGYTVESYDYFHVYASAVSGLSPFYRCLLSDGHHFYTGSDTCEGAPGAIREGTIGWVAGSAVCGAVPLYRLWSADGHLFTHDASERAAAIAGGWVDEGITAYVWRAP